MDSLKPKDIYHEWKINHRPRLEKAMKRLVEKAMDETGVVALINHQASPTVDEIENSSDLSLGILDIDERVTFDVQLEIDQFKQEHCWEITVFLPSLLEGDSVVHMCHQSPFTNEANLSDDEIPYIYNWLRHEFERIHWHIDRNEEENSENFRFDREKRWDEEQAQRERERHEMEQRLERERLEKERQERIAAEDAFIDKEIRLQDPLVGAFKMCYNISN